MDLTCITPYKLDALKAVRRSESDDFAASHFPQDVVGIEERIEKTSMAASDDLDAELVPQSCG